MQVGPFDEIHPYEGMMMEAHNAEVLRLVEMTGGTDALSARILRLWRNHRTLRGQPELPDETSYVDRAIKRALMTVTLGVYGSDDAELCTARIVHLGGSAGRLGSLVSASGLQVAADSLAAELARYAANVRHNLIARLSIEAVHELAHDIVRARDRSDATTYSRRS